MTKIGYACITENIADMKYHTCIQKNATPEKLKELITLNLQTLDKMIDYNIENNILLFRINSEIIPFASSPVNTLDWQTLYSSTLQAIGDKAKKATMRLSMHPGQYTVLNSPNPTIVENAIKDLAYHSGFLDSLGLDSSNKMILHIGGIYGDKVAAIKRFIANWKTLNDSIKNRLIIENDDRLYNIEDVLYISQQTGIPVIFDNLHHAINQPKTKHSEITWLRKCQATWKSKDGKQKTHYSQQDKNKHIGAHSSTIEIIPFLEYYQRVKELDFDIMLEVKDKNLSAIKCIHCTTSPSSKDIEQVWLRYQDVVRERSYSLYNKIATSFQIANSFSTITFYQDLETALRLDIDKDLAIDTAKHIWHYFTAIASKKEETSFMTHLDKYQKGMYSLSRIKKLLWRYTKKYQIAELLTSYYFHN